MILSQFSSRVTPTSLHIELKFADFCVVLQVSKVFLVLDQYFGVPMYFSYSRCTLVGHSLNVEKYFLLGHVLMGAGIPYLGANCSNNVPSQEHLREMPV